MRQFGITERRLFYLIAAFLVCLALAAPAAFAKEVQFDEHRRHYRIWNVDPKEDSQSSQRLFAGVEYTIRAEMETLDGRTVVVIHRDEKTAGGDRVEYKFYVDPENLQTLRLERNIISRHDKQVLYFDHYYANHYYKYKPNTFHQGLFPYIGQAMDLKPGAETVVYILLTPALAPTGLIFTVEDEETVTSPAGTFECFRIKVSYKTDELSGALGKMPKFFINFLMPNIFFWVEKKEPHTVIKLQGRIDGFDQPEKVHELIKVE